MYNLSTIPVTVPNRVSIGARQILRSFIYNSKNLRTKIRKTKQLKRLLKNLSCKTL